MIKEEIMGYLFSILLLAMFWVISGLCAAWSGGGMEKFFRRIIISAMTTLIGMISLCNFWAVFLMSRSGVLSLGYGIPDVQTHPEPRDKGSAIGRFWWRILTKKGTEEYPFRMRQVAIITRATIGLAQAFAVLPVPIIQGTLLAFGIWILAAILFCVNNVLFGAIIQKEGTMKLFGRDLAHEEIYIHGNDTVIITFLILLCR